MPAPKVRSKDSVQQRLRDHKREWNSTYRDFSQKLKAFKDGLNGRGNAKVGLPPSNIKEPFPGEVGSYLNQLAGEFQSLVGDAGTIISEQEQYARTRRRRKPKAPKVPTETPVSAPVAPAVPAPGAEEKAAEQLARLGISQNDLNKIASSKASRFWQYFKAIFSNKQFNKQRVGLLRQAADMYYALLDFEEDALSMKINQIPKASSSFLKFGNSVSIFVETFQGMMEYVSRATGEKPPSEPNVEKKEEPSKPTPPVPQPTPPPSKSKLSLDIEQIEEDKHLLFNAGLAKEQIIHLNNMFKEYKEETDPQLKNMWASRIKEYYKDFVMALAEEVQKKYGPANIRGVEDIIHLVRANAADETISQYMVKNASSISRFLKKKLLQLAPGSKAASVRLEISEIIDELKEIIKRMMDVIEKLEVTEASSLQEIQTLMDQLSESMDRIQRPLHILNTYYMETFFEGTMKKPKGKKPGDITQEEDMINYILKRKLKRQLSRGLT